MQCLEQCFVESACYYPPKDVYFTVQNLDSEPFKQQLMEPLHRKSNLHPLVPVPSKEYFVFKKCCSGFKSVSNTPVPGV